MTDQCSSCGGFCGKRCLRENVKPIPKDTITIPRALLEQALKAFEVATTPLAEDRQEVLAAVAALRSTLEQPQEKNT